MPSAEKTWELSVAERGPMLLPTCFDVGSTVIVEEEIDELAAHLGKGEAIAAVPVDLGVFLWC